jgi:hypothetical protein
MEMGELGPEHRGSHGSLLDVWLGSSPSNCQGSQLLGQIFSVLIDAKLYAGSFIYWTSYGLWAYNYE